jgi:hypothetical protein
MLRNKYVFKYREKNQNELDTKMSQIDDNFVLNSNRPLSDRAIKDLPANLLHTFVDDVLKNKKLGSLLFSTNAKKEIAITSKESQFYNSKNKNKKSDEKKISNPMDIIKNRVKRETISQITHETTKFKEERKNLKENFENKCEEFFKNLRAKDFQKKTEQEKLLNTDRKQILEKVFFGIKEKLNTSRTCRNQTGKKIWLPDLSLNVNDVYSRLYHNAVLPTSASENSQRNFKENLITDKKEKILNKNNRVLNIRNVIDSSNGKEFTIKITEEVFMKCLFKHSGGPAVIENVKITF